MFQVLSLYGQTSQIEALQLSASEKKEAVKAQGYGAIGCAAQNGHLDTLKHLESHLTDSVLCHQVVTVDEDLLSEENELLHPAVSKKNAAAAVILMCLPGVQRLEQANRFMPSLTLR